MLSGDLAVLQRYVQQHGALDGADNVFGFDRSDPRYAKEEILVETAAITRTESIARPRIAAERKYGNVTKTNRLQALLDDALKDSRKYIEFWSRKVGD